MFPRTSAVGTPALLQSTGINILFRYLWTYVYDDAGKLLYEASSYLGQAQQVEMLSQEPPEGSKGDP